MLSLSKSTYFRVKQDLFALRQTLMRGVKDTDVRKGLQKSGDDQGAPAFMWYHLLWMYIRMYVFFYVWRMKWRGKKEMSHRKSAWAASWYYTLVLAPSDLASGAVLRINGQMTWSCRGEEWGRDQPCFLVAPHRCPGPWILPGVLKTTTGRENQLPASIRLLWIPRGWLHVCKHQQTQVSADPKALEGHVLFCTRVQLQQTPMRFPNFPKASAPIAHLFFSKA